MAADAAMVSGRTLSGARVTKFVERGHYGFTGRQGFTAVRDSALAGFEPAPLPASWRLRLAWPYAIWFQWARLPQFHVAPSRGQAGFTVRLQR